MGHDNQFTESEHMQYEIWQYSQMRQAAKRSPFCARRLIQNMHEQSSTEDDELNKDEIIAHKLVLSQNGRNKIPSKQKMHMNTSS